MEQRRAAVHGVWSAGQAAMRALPGLRIRLLEFAITAPAEAEREEAQEQYEQATEKVRKFNELAAVREAARAVAGEREGAGGVYWIDWPALDVLVELEPEKEGPASGVPAGPKAVLTLFDGIEPDAAADAGLGGADFPGEEPDYRLPEDLEVEYRILGQAPGPSTLAFESAFLTEEERRVQFLLGAIDADDEDPEFGG